MVPTLAEELYNKSLVLTDELKEYVKASINNIADSVSERRKLSKSLVFEKVIIITMKYK